MKNKLADWSTQGVPGAGEGQTKPGGLTTAEMRQKMATWEPEY